MYVYQFVSVQVRTFSTVHSSMHLRHEVRDELRVARFKYAHTYNYKYKCTYEYAYKCKCKDTSM